MNPEQLKLGRVYVCEFPWDRKGQKCEVLEIGDLAPTPSYVENNEIRSQSRHVKVRVRFLKDAQETWSTSQDLVPVHENREMTR